MKHFARIQLKNHQDLAQQWLVGNCVSLPLGSSWASWPQGHPKSQDFGHHQHVLSECSVVNEKVFINQRNTLPTQEHRDLMNVIPHPHEEEWCVLHWSVTSKFIFLQNFKSQWNSCMSLRCKRCISLQNRQQNHSQIASNVTDFFKMGVSKRLVFSTGTSLVPTLPFPARTHWFAETQATTTTSTFP